MKTILKYKRGAATSALLLCAAIGCLSGAPPVSAAESKERSEAGSAEPLADLIVSGFKRPVRIRLVVASDGQSWTTRQQTSLRRYLQSLFVQLDSDADGRLSSQEAQRLPSPQAFMGRDSESERYVAFNFRVLDADDDKTASFDELRDYLAGFGGNALQLLTAEKPKSPADLFSALDTDRDGRLDRGEWSQPARLLENDRDGNRVLTAAELRPPSQAVFGPEFVAAPLGPRERREPLAFRAVPATADNADVLITIHLSSQDAAVAPAITIESSADDLPLTARTFSDGPAVLHLAVLHLDQRRVELRVLPPVFRADAQFRRTLRREFDAAAENSQGRVTADGDLPPLLASLFSLADGDSDNILTPTEFDRCVKNLVDTRLAAEAARMRLIVFEERDGLEALVDRNLDGRLGLRELVKLPSRLAALSAADHQLARAQVPATISLVLQPGPFFEAAGAGAVLNAGPPWFYRADVNQDGDLSRDEFLGSSRAFGRLDANGDDWIDLDEAIRGDRLFAATNSEEEVLP